MSLRSDAPTRTPVPLPLAESNSYRGGGRRCDWHVPVATFQESNLRQKLHFSTQKSFDVWVPPSPHRIRSKDEFCFSRTPRPSRLQQKQSVHPIRGRYRGGKIVFQGCPNPDNP